MSPPVAHGRRPPARRKSKRVSPWLHWWPLALALAVTPFAVGAASMLALSGPGALRLLYPFMVLVQHAPMLRGIPAEWVLWAQFPVYGLLAVGISRWRGTVAGIVAASLLHLAAAGTAALIARG